MAAVTRDVPVRDEQLRIRGLRIHAQVRGEAAITHHGWNGWQARCSAGGFLQKAREPQSALTSLAL